MSEKDIIRITGLTGLSRCNLCGMESAKAMLFVEKDGRIIPACAKCVPADEIERFAEKWKRTDGKKLDVAGMGDK